MGGKSTGPNPTDRAKSGTKRSLLVDGQGIPIGITVDCANRHDMKMTSGTLQSLAICRPESTLKTHQHMCLDKGHDFPEVYELLEDYEYIIHIRKRGERNYKLIPRYRRTRRRRWVVERTHSWMNRFRRLLIRWEKRVDNYIAILHFACAWITYKRCRLFG